MVLAFVALVALANGILGGGRRLVRLSGAVVPDISARSSRRSCTCSSIPWDEAGAAGGLFGTKVVLNEFVAFIDLGQPAGALSPMTVAIVTFALCGFANFSSIAIQMAVTGGLAPNQRPMIAKLGLRALLAGSLANLMSAALAGLFLSIATILAAAPPPPPPAPTTPAAPAPAPRACSVRSAPAPAGRNLTRRAR